MTIEFDGAGARLHVTVVPLDWGPSGTEAAGVKVMGPVGKYQTTFSFKIKSNILST